MKTSADAIRIRVMAREAGPERGDPRDAFWAPLRETKDFSNLRTSQVEAKLCREFGGKLRSSLLHQLSQGIREIDSDLFPGSLRDFEHFFFRYMEPRSEREMYGYQFAEAFTRYLENRQQLLRENASLRDAQERLVAAAGVFFSTRIVGYSSLNFDLSTGSFQQLAKAFDGNFDTFRIFLDAFVPVAFAEVFNEDFSDRFEFSVAIPTSVEDAFSTAVQTIADAQPTAVPVGGQTLTSAPQSASRERAEWIWRLANGSLLIPLLIALAVMYYGMRMLTDIRNAQYEAIQPILQHQLELLKEDRLRMSGTNVMRDSTAPAAVSASDQDGKDGK